MAVPPEEFIANLFRCRESMQITSMSGSGHQSTNQAVVPGPVGHCIHNPFHCAQGPVVTRTKIMSTLPSHITPCSVLNAPGSQ